MKKQNILTIERPGDENIIIKVNGEEVASATHDDHGWSGMEAVENCAKAVATALGAEIDDD